MKKTTREDVIAYLKSIDRRNFRSRGWESGGTICLRQAIQLVRKLEPRERKAGKKQ